MGLLEKWGRVLFWTNQSITLHCTREIVNIFLFSSFSLSRLCVYGSCYERPLSVCAWMKRVNGGSFCKKIENFVFPCPCPWIWSLIFVFKMRDKPFFSCCPEPRPWSYSTPYHPPLALPASTLYSSPLVLLHPGYLHLKSVPSFTPLVPSFTPLVPSFTPFIPILYAIDAYNLRHQRLRFTSSVTILYAIYAKTPSLLSTNSLPYITFAIDSSPTTPQLFANDAVYILCPHQRHHGLPQLYASNAIYVLCHL